MDKFSIIKHKQQEICKKYNFQELEPDDMVAVALSTIGKMPVYGCRVEIPKNGNISWFLHCGEYSNKDDFYQPIHTSHLYEILPLVLSYLRLPLGSRFIIDDNGFEDVWMS